MIAKPLTELLKKGSVFVWTSDHQLAFQASQKALSSAPVLSLPDFSIPFCIETDARFYHWSNAVIQIDLYSTNL
jgi:hypothetical protein